MPIDLQSIAGNAVDTIFDQFDQIRDAGTYNKSIPGSYDPTVGTDPATSAATAIRPIFGFFKHKEMDGELVRAGDRKLFVKTSELTTEPQVNDWYVAANGTRWDVFMVGIEPTRKLWVLGVRAHRK